MEDPGKNIICIRNLDLGYRETGMLIEGIQASAEKGELVALIGRNGTGKSTLLRTLAVLQQQLAGEVLINGNNNRKIPVHRFSRELSFVASGITLSEKLSVYELVSLGRYPYTNWWGGLSAKDDKKIREAIGFVSMEKFTDKAVDQLSDGERQRVFIARALAQETEIMILDEPTAFLDLPNTFEILNLLHNLKQHGKTIVYSTHDLENAFLFADKCWVINEMKLLEGSVEDLGLKHVFKDLFSSSGIQFNERDMKFIPDRPSENTIRLDIRDKEIAMWTKRCLERTGFGISEERDDGFAVVSHKIINGESIWMLSFKDYRNEFSTLYDMARYLSKIS